MPEKSSSKKELKILIATANPGKFKEFEQFLSGLSVQLLSLRDFPEIKDFNEPYGTFEENAYHKALTAHIQTGMVSLGDDSGLEVDALKGAPGVYSARFAGEDADDERNNQKLLSMMREVPWERRTARFRCVLALAMSRDEIKLVEGEARGYILFEPRGDMGFGYDPVFYCPEMKKSFAELSPEEKMRVSHRGDALRKLRDKLMDYLESSSGRRG